MGDKQKTIASPVTVSGKGLHTGVEVNLTIKPASENSGIRFKRTDIKDQPEINADCFMVTDTNRGTTIGMDGSSVSTIEHVMAALRGMEIDNALIEIDNFETPIKDGSSKFFTQAMTQVGTAEQNADKECFVLDKILILYGS